MQSAPHRTRSPSRVSQIQHTAGTSILAGFLTANPGVNQTPPAPPPLPLPDDKAPSSDQGLMELPEGPGTSGYPAPAAPDDRSSPILRLGFPAALCERPSWPLQTLRSDPASADARAVIWRIATQVQIWTMAAQHWKRSFRGFTRRRSTRCASHQIAKLPSFGSTTLPFETPEPQVAAPSPGPTPPIGGPRSSRSLGVIGTGDLSGPSTYTAPFSATTVDG